MLEDYIQSKINEGLEFIQNDTQSALEIFDEVLEIEPDNIDAINGKGSSLMKLNRLDEADECFNQSLSICENSSALINKGMISKKNNDYQAAINYYDSAINLNPNLGNIVGILKSEVMELMNDDSQIDLTGFSDDANELIQKGMNYKNDNKLWDALDCFNQAIKADPSCESTLISFIDEIKTIFQKELLYDLPKLNMENKIDRIKMQSLRAFNDNNPKKALTLMNLILEIDGNDLNTLNHKGIVLYQLGECGKAIDCFDKCLDVDNTYYMALFNKAFVLRRMNKLDESLECFNELLKTPQYQNKAKPYRQEILKKLPQE